MYRKRASVPSDIRLCDYTPLFPGLSDIDQTGPCSDSLAGSIKRANAASENRFCFLNRSVTFEHEPGWQDSDRSRLWRFHLHYFDIVQDLAIWSAVEKGAPAYETFRRLIDSWIDRNSFLSGDGWHPYTISVRLANWLLAVPTFDTRMLDDDVFRNRFIGSLFGQAQMLFDDLELDVRGNHIIKNLRALLIAGVCFEGTQPSLWFERSLELLKQEFVEQILPDGGHFERTPGYHLEVLKDCLEIAIWLRSNTQKVCLWLDDALVRMLNYLVKILPPDGRLPLLKDTAEYPAPGDLLAAGSLYLDSPKYKKTDAFGLYPVLLFGSVGWKKFNDWPVNRASQRSVCCRETGHFVMRDDPNGVFLIFDAGKPSPDYLPAHAHSDMLSYELTIHGLPVVVDSGVYEYTPGEWRDFFRSTRAHNTVEIDGKNQSEVWSSFRMARRARPGPVAWKEADDHVYVRGSHNGYRTLAAPAIHQRTVVWQKGCFWLFVDEISGRGSVKTASYIHLHPKLSFVRVDSASWKVQECPFPLWLTAFGNKDASIARGQKHPDRQGWYSERFGELRKNNVLCLLNEDGMPFSQGYVISTSQAPAKLEVTSVSGRNMEIMVSVDHRNFRLRLRSGRAEYLR